MRQHDSGLGPQPGGQGREAPGASAASARPEPRGSFHRLFLLLSPRDRRNAAFLCGLMLLVSAFELVGLAAIPAFVAAVVDPGQLRRFDWPGLQWLTSQPSQTIILWGSLALALIFAAKTAVYILNQAMQLRYINNRRVDLTRRLTRAYVNAPYTFHLTRNTAELLRNVDHEVGGVSRIVLAALLELGTRLTVLAAVLAFLLVVEPQITLFWLLLFGSMAAAVVFFLGSRLQRLGLREQQERARLVQAINQALNSVKESQILQRGGYFVDRVAASISRLCRVAFRARLVERCLPPLSEFVAVLGLLVLAVGLILLNRPIETILVTISLFAVALVRMREAMSKTMTAFAQLRSNMASVDAVYRDLTLLESMSAGRRPKPALGAPRRLERALELRDIWYKYDGADAHSLKAVHLTIPAGAAVGFVGATGAGKSTLIDVLLGLLEPQRGQVLVDGRDVRERGLAEWQHMIGYVPQSIYLIDDSIRRNIALGIEDEDVDEEALATAVRAAQLEALIRRLPQGLSTRTGEHGVRLSGGERQRIGIARALYHNPSVLVLDEATSALDVATERAVISAVEALKGQRTVVMIAHRLSTVRNCDLLYLLKDGRIEAHGSYDELRSSHAEFAAFAIP